jgi:uncharacterized protein (TIGR02996 family)
VTEENAFQNALDADPADATTRLVFGDWLEEHGDPRSEGYRALGLLRLRPYPFGDTGRWTWLNSKVITFYGNATRRKIREACSVLPDDWFSLVEEHRHGCGCAAERRNAAQSFDDAAIAFAKLPESRRRELLAHPAGVTP